MIRLLNIIILLLLVGCFNRKPDPHIPWYPHHVSFWVLTPGGFIRDGGPFSSLAAGYTNDTEINQAIDDQFNYFYSKFPQYTWVRPNVAINDDYVFWPPDARTWVSGLSYGIGTQTVWVALWLRVETIDEPGDCWIKRAPGTYWGVYYQNWRHTDRPLAPALAHELLHCAIGDPNHTSPDWGVLQRKAIIGPIPEDKF
jgi:hypothetical protein